MVAAWTISPVVTMRSKSCEVDDLIQRDADEHLADLVGAAAPLGASPRGQIDHHARQVHARAPRQVRPTLGSAG